MATPRRSSPVLSVPMQPAAIAHYQRVMADDVTEIAKAAGLALQPSVRAEDVAARLDAAISGAVGRIAGNAWATPGANAVWAREVERRARALLDCFTSADDSGDPIEQAARLLRGPGGFLERFGTLHGAGLREMLVRLAALTDRISAAATEYEAHKGAPRPAPHAELVLIAELANAYEAAFGRKAGVSTLLSGQKAGPFIRFLSAVADHIERDWVAIASGRDAALVEVLDRMRDPSRAAERFRGLHRMPDTADHPLSGNWVPK